jgi:ribosomal protein L11 methyltransferase
VLPSSATALAPTSRVTLSSDYWTLTVTLDPEASDAVANFLWEVGATGVVEEGADPPVALRAFFPPGSEPLEVQPRLEGYLGELRSLAIPVGPGTVAVSRVPEEAWADAWRAHFRPLRIGRRLLVVPPWEQPAATPGDGAPALIVIEPGRAFGTGSHGSTRSCLELLERALEGEPVEQALDVGTGSGILAIAAARLGVASVAALDLDPDAVAAAAANAARNGVAGRVRVELGGPEACARAAPLVLANLLGSALVALAPVLARCTTAPGRLIAGGLLVHEVPVVTASFVPEGFALAEVVEREGWAALLLAR